VTNELYTYIADDSGQGITEYGAIIAFVAILIVVVAQFAGGPMNTALSECYSNVSFALNQLNAAVS